MAYDLSRDIIYHGKESLGQEHGAALSSQEEQIGSRNRYNNPYRTPMTYFLQ